MAPFSVFCQGHYSSLNLVSTIPVGENYQPFYTKYFCVVVSFPSNPARALRSFPSSPLSPKGSLNKGVFERRRQPEVSFSYSRTVVLPQISGKSSHFKDVSSSNQIASRHLKRKNVSLSVDVCHSKTPLLKLPNSLCMWRRQASLNFAIRIINENTANTRYLLQYLPAILAECANTRISSSSPV